MGAIKRTLNAQIHSVAEQAVSSYVQGILPVDVLEMRIWREWQDKRFKEDQASSAVLKRIAQRICSGELCRAWRSDEPEKRNTAFQNLRRYLERSLRHTRYARSLIAYENAFEDVLHQTLQELWVAINRNAGAGPDDPTAFLKWVHTILMRQAHLFFQKSQQDSCLSLEECLDVYTEQIVDRQNADPQEYILTQELYHALEHAILSLQNDRYRQVLLYTYLASIDERDLAQRWEVPVQDVYLWRHRALKALRKKREVMQLLQSLRC